MSNDVILSHDLFFFFFFFVRKRGKSGGGTRGNGSTWKLLCSAKMGFISFHSSSDTASSDPLTNSPSLTSMPSESASDMEFSCGTPLLVAKILEMFFFFPCSLKSAISTTIVVAAGRVVVVPNTRGRGSRLTELVSQFLVASLIVVAVKSLLLLRSRTGLIALVLLIAQKRQSLLTLSGRHVGNRGLLLLALLLLRLLLLALLLVLSGALVGSLGKA